MIKREVKRDLKFRAWDKKRKEWYGKSNPYSLTFYGFAIFGECTLLCPPSADHLVDIEVTQYTGFKDCQGKDIYEGDILGPKYNWRVAWKDDGWQCIQEIKANNATLSRLIKLRETAGVPIKIVGNIYEGVKNSNES